MSTLHLAVNVLIFGSLDFSTMLELAAFLGNAGDWLHSQLRWGLPIFLQDPDTRCILHLILGPGTTMCTLHLMVHVLVLHDVLAMPRVSLNAFAFLR